MVGEVAIALVVGSFAALVYAVAAFNKRALRRFANEVANDPSLRLFEEGRGQAVALALARSRLVHSVRNAQLGRNPVWEFRCETGFIESSVLVSLEGSFGALREKLGVSDVHVGDAVFDARFTLHGSGPDM